MLLATLTKALRGQSWEDVEEIPSAVDLWGRPRRGHRVIFEAKTVSTRSEPVRLRAALAQLLEYRFFWGEPEDELCIVTTAPVSDERIRFLRTLGVDVVWFSDGRATTRGRCINESVAGLVGAASQN
jgi:hypothetical protein